MISATDALSSIQRALQGVRREEDRLVEMLRSATGEVDRIRLAQAEGFRALARLKLSTLAGSDTLGALDGAEQRAKKVLESRRAALEAAADKRHRIATRVDDLEDKAEAAARERDAAVAAIENKTAEVEAAVIRSEAWLAADKAAKIARATAAGADEKAKQSEGDRAAKGAPYEADSIFMYLWNRGFGTSAYRGWGIVRWIDGKVAARIDYEPARQNYYLLNEIPKRLREHAERLAADAVTADATRETVERKALEAAGIEALEAAAAAAEARLGEAEAALTAARSELEAADGAARDLTDASKDPALAGAVDDLAKAMQRDDLRLLYRKALDTPTTEDEAIVKQLQELERALVKASAQVEEVRAASVDLARKRSELERSEGNFRKSGYDNPLGEFINENVIGSVIEGIVKGALSGRSLDDAFGNGYRRRSNSPMGSSGPFGGGLRLPSRGSSGNSGPGRMSAPSPSRAPSSGSRSSGGGGFRTSDSF